MLGREPQVGIEAIMEASPESRKRYQETRDPFALEKPLKAPEGTNDMQNYEFYVSQETKAGRTPKSFEAFQATKRPSTNITNVLPGEKVSNKYGEEFAGLLAKQDAAALEAGDLAIPQIESSYRVRDLLAQGVSEAGPLASVGYREAILALREGWSESQLHEAICQSTLRLAKKQRTWFQRDPEIQWFDAKRDMPRAREVLLKAFA
jgi:tRNA A37 N6-isopentenylltransferase MiaA